METLSTLLSVVIVLGCLIGAAVMFVSSPHVDNSTIMGFTLLIYARLVATT